ncbi:DUF58 domain-containing protein [Actinomarinicola tropica]|uniref:DUF58 domain-containing protein n=1 Tax=Actinomarinicola tropica TaxID=2789776 RepID=A0A5Q2RRS2_9ACTN|nr:DUF58 domain-containing protein [Actinomarinicola tropica]QGG96847.1 DUF58 domain-containing protein [Actinomarinicola tropica]
MAVRARARLVGAACLATLGLVVAVASSRPEPVALAAPFLVTLLVGLAVDRAPGGEVMVRIGTTRAVAGDEIDVEARVVAAGSVGSAEVRLVVPDGTTLVEGHPAVEDVVVDGRCEFRWRLRADRWGGIGPLTVDAALSDRLGLRVARVAGASAPLRVLPDEASLRRIAAPRALRTIPGGHGSRQRGEGIEPADVRPFVPGDRARNVNWRVTARRGDLWVDERHPDRSGEVVLFVDSFAAATSDRDDTLRRTVELARALAGRHLAANDRVGLVDLGGVLRWVRPAGGTVQLYRLAEALADTEVWRSEVDKPLEVMPARALPQRALVVVLSPLLDVRSTATVRRMRARGLDLAVVEVVPDLELPAGADSRARVAHRLWRMERDAVREEIRRAGVALVPWEVGTGVEQAVDELVRHREAVARWAR